MRAEITPGSVPNNSSARCIGNRVPAIGEAVDGDDRGLFTDGVKEGNLR
jgi:hypothetical protein